MFKKKLVPNPGLLLAIIFTSSAIASVEQAGAEAFRSGTTSASSETQKMLIQVPPKLSLNETATIPLLAQVPTELSGVQPQNNGNANLIQTLNQGDTIANDWKTTAQNVTSVSQLSDVKPTDWAFTALQSLVERYGCIAGYPDRTYKGQRATTRYEFAAGLNACLDKINEIISAGLADKVSKEDLAAVQKLQEEFAAELAAIKGRVDALEAKTAQLEAQQFSTTTKLTGEALFSLRAVFDSSNNRPDNSGAAPGVTSQFEGPLGKNTTLGYRIRLNFDTSFSGRDQLLLRLQASNITRQRVSAFTSMGALQPDDTTGDNNDRFGLLPGTPATGQTSDGIFRLDTARYTFPIGDRANLRIIGTGGQLNDFAPTLNALDYGDDSGLGSITEFGQHNPIYRLSGAGAGFGLDYKFSDAIRLSVGYLGGNRTSAGNPSLVGGSGLFGGTYGAIAQLTVSPSKNFDIGLTYVRTYLSGQDVLALRPGVSGGVGSHHSDVPLGGGPMEENSYGLETMIKFSPGFILSGWAGLSDVTAPAGGVSPLGFVLSQPGAKATIFNWAITFAFPDLFKEGSLGGIVFGQPPKVTGGDGGPFPTVFTGGVTGLPLQDYKGDSFQIELFYRYAISNNINITPGVVIITNPEYNSANPTLILGTIRTTFTF